MAELLYDNIYDDRQAMLLEIVHKIEANTEPAVACEELAFVAGLSAKDLQRIIRLRQLHPASKTDRITGRETIPAVFVQKSLLLDGRYGEDARKRAATVDAMTRDQKLALLSDFIHAGIAQEARG